MKLLLSMLLSFVFFNVNALELNKISGYSTFSWDEGGSEILAYDSQRNRIFVTNNITKSIDVLDITRLPYTEKLISIIASAIFFLSLGE